MGFEYNIDIRRKITVNGKDYASVDDVPEELRQPMKDAMHSALPGSGHRKISVNGAGYDSPEAMPPEIRRTYEEALKKAGIAAQRTGIHLPPPGDGGIKLETSLSGRALTILAALAALAGLIKLFFG